MPAGTGKRVQPSGPAQRIVPAGTGSHRRLLILVHTVVPADTGSHCRHVPLSQTAHLSQTDGTQLALLPIGYKAALKGRIFCVGAGWRHICPGERGAAGSAGHGNLRRAVPHTGSHRRPSPRPSLPDSTSARLSGRERCGGHGNRARHSRPVPDRAESEGSCLPPYI
jgi:hypothetical protein